MKRCRECEQDLPFDEFYRHPTCAGGHLHTCKTCTQARRKAQRDADPDFRVRKSAQDKRRRTQIRAERDSMFPAGRKCQWCASDLDSPKASTRYCSKQCQDRAYYARNRERIKARVREWDRLNPERAAANSKAWKTNNRERARWLGAQYAHRRRARIAGRLIEEFDRLEIFARDEWICGLCGGPVAKPDASLDHVIPLSRGGEHSRANVQLAHINCNKAKGARLPEEMAA